MAKIPLRKSTKSVRPVLVRADIPKKVKQIENDPLQLSRWLALLNGIRTIDEHEQMSGVPADERQEIDFYKLKKYVDESAPIFEKEIIKGL